VLSDYLYARRRSGVSLPIAVELKPTELEGNMAKADGFFNVNIEVDDGNFLIFAALDPNTGQPWPLDTYTGFMHRPTETSKPFGNPPVTWSQFSDLGTWVETVKYAYRNNQSVYLVYDDAIVNTYQPSYGGGWALQHLYAVTPLRG
jgi:hypothetical protein